jgi:hypothetical protein
MNIEESTGNAGKNMKNYEKLNIRGGKTKSQSS